MIAAFTTKVSGGPGAGHRVCLEALALDPGWIEFGALRIAIAPRSSTPPAPDRCWVSLRQGFVSFLPGPACHLGWDNLVLLP